jgi:hypothetical protein
MLITADFNEIRFSHDKEGENPQPNGYMQAFRDALIDSELEDIGFHGEKFTWKRGKIQEKLDRALSDGEWALMHIGASIVVGDDGILGCTFTSLVV